MTRPPRAPLSQTALAILCAVIAAGCLLLAFRLVSPEQAEYLIAAFGYHLTFLLAGLWALAAGRQIPYRNWFCQWPRTKLARVGFVGIVTVFTWGFSPIGFKVLNDETLLSAVSASMHFDRLAVVPNRGVDLGSGYEYLDGAVNKRPLLFPFLVSVVHDLTGYRPENAFVLNALLTPVFWLVVFLLARSIRDREADGYLAVLLLLGAPLTTHLATSGGFDFLNTLLSLGLVLLARHWWAHPENRGAQNVFVLTLLLLAHTRYEGALWILPWGGFILYQWWRTRQPGFNWVLLAAPVFMLPAALSRRISSEFSFLWQKGIFDRTELLSWHYVGENLIGARDYFVGLGQLSSASYLLTVVGLGSLALGAVGLFRKKRDGARPAPAANDSPKAVWIAYGAGLVLLFALLMVFNWGYFNNPISARLSFPFFPALALLAVAALGFRPVWWYGGAMIVTTLAASAFLRFAGPTSFWEEGIPLLVASTGTLLVFGICWKRHLPPERCLLVVAGLFFVFVARPRIADARYEAVYPPARETPLIWDFLERHADINALYVTDYTVPLALARVPFVRVPLFEQKLEQLAERQTKHRAYQEVYYLQIEVYDHEGGLWHSLYRPLRDERVERELVERIPVAPYREIHFYRLKVKDLPPPATTDGPS